MLFRVLLLVLCFTGNIFNIFACPFCKDLEIYGQTFKQLYSDVAKESSMILMQTKHFYVISDNYPVAYGHLLIVPKKHITSFAAINVDMATEITFILSKLKNVFHTSEYILFEHGCRLLGETIISSGNSVYHAHLHFIPNISINESAIKNLLSEYGLILKNSPLLNTSLDYLGDEKLLLFLKQNTECLVNGEKDFESYLFLKYSNDKAFVIPESHLASKVPSQFFRKVFAIIANGQEAFWDWKNPISDEIVKILQSRLTFVLTKFNEKTNLANTCVNPCAG